MNLDAVISELPPVLTPVQTVGSEEDIARATLLSLGKLTQPSVNHLLSASRAMRLRSIAWSGTAGSSDVVGAGSGVLSSVVVSSGEAVV